MYTLYETSKEKNCTMQYFAKYRRKEDAEKAAFWRVRFMRAEEVRICYNGKKVCEYFWLTDYKTKRKIQVINCTWGNFKTCFPK